MNKDEVSNPDCTQTPSLIKLGACFIYDALAVVALCFVSALVVIILIGDASYGLKRYLLQVVLWLAIGIYFVWCWKKTGQTLAMKTWQLKLVSKDGQLLPLNLAMARYVLSTLSLVLFGLGFLWAMVDRDHLYLHDRLLNTHIIYVPRDTTC
ncbi:MAG: RDD family protein [Sulfuritalea sp.]|jgi:uncharacterized RDD family membrane protein YckC|nr:RDD family protein [Sulfuritalea sp.]